MKVTFKSYALQVMALLTWLCAPVPIQLISSTSSLSWWRTRKKEEETDTWITTRFREQLKLLQRVTFQRKSRKTLM